MFSIKMELTMNLKINIKRFYIYYSFVKAILFDT